MSCSCQKNRDNHKEKPANMTTFQEAVSINNAVAEEQDRIKPNEQCIACAYKHFSEALCLFTEYSYENENRMLLCGELRCVVRHTYMMWKDIATLARECSLLINEARDAEAWDKMRLLADMISEAFYDVNPEVKTHIEELKKQHGENK